MSLACVWGGGAAGEQEGSFLVDTGMHSFEGSVELMRLADVLLHPSKTEGFGMPLLEAQSLGTPIVTTVCMHAWHAWMEQSPAYLHAARTSTEPFTNSLSLASPFLLPTLERRREGRVPAVSSCPCFAISPPAGLRSDARQHKVWRRRAAASADLLYPRPRRHASPRRSHAGTSPGHVETPPTRRTTALGPCHRCGCAVSLSRAPPPTLSWLFGSLVILGAHRPEYWQAHGRQPLRGR